MGFQGLGSRLPLDCFRLRAELSTRERGRKRPQEGFRVSEFRGFVLEGFSKKRFRRVSSDQSSMVSELQQIVFENFGSLVRHCGVGTGWAVRAAVESLVKM